MKKLKKVITVISWLTLMVKFGVAQTDVRATSQIQMQDLVEEAYVSVYPNPMVTESVVEFRGPQESWMWRLYNVAGELMQETTNHNLRKVVVRSADLPTGLYIYVVQAKGFISKRKLVVSQGSPQ